MHRSARSVPLNRGVTFALNFFGLVFLRLVLLPLGPQCICLVTCELGRGDSSCGSLNPQLRNRNQQSKYSVNLKLIKELTSVAKEPVSSLT